MVMEWIKLARARPSLVVSLFLTALLLPACSGGSPGGGSPTAESTATSFETLPVAKFENPWAMTFLPDGMALVTEKGGTLQLVDPTDGSKTTVGGTPEVVNRGQGGLGDVILGPTFAQDRGIYLSWIEEADDGTGAVVGRATLGQGPQPELGSVEIIWRQDKTDGDGHFSHRMAISPDQKYLFVTSGERQEKLPAQDLDTNLGKVLRLNLDGTPAANNPFADRGGVSAEIWSYGQRNPLGIAFDPDGNLWSSEMGPKGGDEVNLIEAGKNYGWPKASNGSNYSGTDIPDHASGDGFESPKVWWNPSTSPGSLMIYTGDAFPEWNGDAFVGALSGEALIRVDVNGTEAIRADQWEMGERIREVEQGPDGALWLLEDGSGGRLLKLTPALR